MRACVCVRLCVRTRASQSYHYYSSAIVHAHAQSARTGLRWDRAEENAHNHKNRACPNASKNNSGAEPHLWLSAGDLRFIATSLSCVLQLHRHCADVPSAWNFHQHSLTRHVARPSATELHEFSILWSVYLRNAEQTAKKRNEKKRVRWWRGEREKRFLYIWWGNVQFYMSNLFIKIVVHCFQRSINPIKFEIKPWWHSSDLKRGCWISYHQPVPNITATLHRSISSLSRSLTHHSVHTFLTQLFLSYFFPTMNVAFFPIPLSLSNTHTTLSLSPILHLS